MFVVDLIERVASDLLGAVSKHCLEVAFVVLADILPLLQLSGDLKKFLDQFGLLRFKLTNADLSADFEEFHDVRSVSLDGLDSHVIVHSLLHKSRISKGFALL